MSTSWTEVSFKQYVGNAAENYERYFVPTIGMAFASALLDTAALHRGERVLDVACGTGVVARLAAERVGSDSVAGLDINPGMLAVARSIPLSGSAIEWHEASAESLPLADESIDVVLSSLGLQFVSDKASALREMRRVLAPDGRLAVATVGPTGPLFEILEQALARHLKPEVAAFTRSVFSLHDSQELEKLTSGAGFRDVEIRTKPLSITLPRPADFLWQYIHSTPLAAAVAEIDEAGRAALEHDVVTGWGSFVKDGALAYDANAILTTATR